MFLIARNQHFRHALSLLEVLVPVNPIATAVEQFLGFYQPLTIIDDANVDNDQAAHSVGCDQAQFLGRSEDEAEALEMIRHAESASADLFLYLLDGATEEQLQDSSFDPEREYMLLRARAMKENLRPPGPDASGEKYIQQSKRYARSLSLLLEAAESGDATANWIIKNLYR